MMSGLVNWLFRIRGELHHSMPLSHAVSRHEWNARIPCEYAVQAWREFVEDDDLFPVVRHVDPAYHDFPAYTYHHDHDLDLLAQDSFCEP